MVVFCPVQEPAPVVIPRMCGWAIQVVADLDGDGASEICLGSPFDDIRSKVGGGSQISRHDSGSLWLLSIRSGKVIDTIIGKEPGEMVGACIQAIKDVNEDGVDDLLVGVPGANSGHGRIDLISGSTRILLKSIAGPDDVSGFGSLFSSPSNNPTGSAQILAVVSQATFLEEERPDKPGIAHLSIIDLALWKTVRTRIIGNEVIARGSLCWVPDNDGDGVEDLLIGVPEASTPILPGAGRIEIISSHSLKTLRALDGKAEHQGLGESLALLTSKDHADIRILAGLRETSCATPGTGGLNAFGLSTLAEADVQPTDNVCRQYVSQYMAKRGSCVASIGDINGDGESDFVEGSPGYYRGELGGGIWLYSGKAMTCLASDNCTPEGARITDVGSGLHVFNATESGHTSKLIAVSCGTGRQFFSGVAIISVERLAKSLDLRHSIDAIVTMNEGTLSVRRFHD